MQPQNTNVQNNNLTYPIEPTGSNPVSNASAGLPGSNIYMGQQLYEPTQNISTPQSIAPTTTQELDGILGISQPTPATGTFRPATLEPSYEQYASQQNAAMLPPLPASYPNAKEKGSNPFVSFVKIIFFTACMLLIFVSGVLFGPRLLETIDPAKNIIRELEITLGVEGLFLLDTAKTTNNSTQIETDASVTDLSLRTYLLEEYSNFEFKYPETNWILSEGTTGASASVQLKNILSDTTLVFVYSDIATAVRCGTNEFDLIGNGSAAKISLPDNKYEYVYSITLPGEQGFSDLYNLYANGGAEGILSRADVKYCIDPAKGLSLKGNTVSVVAEASVDSILTPAAQKLVIDEMNSIYLSINFLGK